MLPEASSEDALAAMNRLRQAVEALQITHVRNPPAGVVTLSIGIATQGPLASSYEALVQQADVAMYRAKHAGRNRVEAFAPAQSETLRQQAPLAAVE